MIFFEKIWIDRIAFLGYIYFDVDMLKEMKIYDLTFRENQNSSYVTLRQR